jgi:hypothetical protein
MGGWYVKVLRLSDRIATITIRRGIPGPIQSTLGLGQPRRRSGPAGFKIQRLNLKKEKHYGIAEEAG